MRQPFSVSLAFVCLVAARPASAQVIEPPARSTNGLFGGARAALDPSRTGQELSATVNLLGSYEDNLTPLDQGVSTDPFLPRQSGTTGAVQGDLQYRRGRASRSIATTGRGYVHSFRNLGITPMYGGNADVFAATQFGQRTTFHAGASGSSQPSFMLAAGAPPSDIEIDTVAPSDPTSGVLDLRTTNLAGNTSITYDWTPRQHTEVAYDYSRVHVTGDGLTNSKSHEAGIRHSWDLSRSLGVLTAYRQAEIRATMSGAPTRPTQNQTATIGVALRKRVSRTRAMLFNFGGGAMHVRATSEASAGSRLFDYVTPSAFVGARLDLGRTWGVAFDANRDVTMLDAISPQSFVTNMYGLRLGGRLARSWLLAFNGTWSEGKPHHGDTGSFEASNGSAQIQYNLMRCCSLVGGYSFYHHLLHDVEAVPAGFPRRFERNAIVVGISMFLPLYGQLAGTGRN